jgi:outer membrane immunogenic protein
MIEPKFRVFDGSVAMRRFLLAAVMFGATAGAHAADMPDFLRGSLPAGPAPTVNWRGFYVGGQYGYGSSDENFNGATSNMIAPLVANNVIQQTGVADWNIGLGKQSARTSAFGGFAGYNSQWDDVILGVEASYLHGNFGGTSTGSEGPLVFPLGAFDHAVGATSQASIAISDMATFRARAGYAYGCFLPYAFAGGALGNADISRSVRVTDAVGTSLLGPFTPLPDLSSNDIEHNHLVYGYTAGIGIDINLIGGLFMRGEWEYTRFTATVDTSINTVRGGLGYRF